MAWVLRSAVLFLACFGVTASGSGADTHNTDDSAHANGVGFAVAAESKQTLTGKALRGPATREREPDPDQDPIPMPSIHFIAEYIDMASKQIATELAYILARPYLNIITNSSPMQLVMGGVASWAYDIEYFKGAYPEGWAGGWKVVAEYVNTTQSLMVDGHDVVVLMAKGSVCAVTFSGTHGLADWSTNFNLRTSSLPQCGIYGVHEGFFENFLQFMLNDAWSEKFEPYLAENCTEVHATGHSQGAAVAAVFAACMNGAGKNLTLPDLWRWGKLVHKGRTVSTRVNVTDLHGYGGPGVSQTQFWNYLAPDGVFPGYRFFNQDYMSFDPVPWLTYAFRLAHTKEAVVKMSDRPQRWAAGTSESMFEPTTVSFVPDIMIHLPAEYIRRIIMATRFVNVKVAYAQGLPERSARPLLGGKPSCYATVEAVNRKWAVTPRTSTKKNTASPTWGETMLLEEYEPGDELEMKLWDAVWPWGADKALGRLKLQSQAFDPHGFEGWVPMDSGIRLKVSVVISYRDLDSL